MPWNHTNSRYLRIFIIVGKAGDLVHLRFINMTDRKMLQKILESKNTEFLAEYVTTEGGYSGDVFNRVA
jgi:hypothetical protein